METIETKISFETKTWLDYLPTEIIFQIFNYLSNNDIVYTFFYFNQRFNSILLQNQRYFTYLKLPTTGINTWKNILPLIGSQIESLNITTHGLSFPFVYFSNLKSLISSSPHELSNKSLKSILNNKQLQNLHALTLRLLDFEDIFGLIQLTPNLKYLNLTSTAPFSRYSKQPTKTNIKLEQIYLTVKRSWNYFDSDSFIRSMQQISSSSLTCLSLNLIDLDTITEEEPPFNSIKLQNLLQSMTELKRFDLYAKLKGREPDKDKILSQFRNQYWIDHNWSFGMHGRYLYTLPFPFDYLHGFYRGFDDVKSNNPEILIHNPRIWYKVKSIELFVEFDYDRNFINQLKIKMPKLNLIKFDHDWLFDKHTEEKPYTSNLQINDINVTLDSVTTIEFTYVHINSDEPWLMKYIDGHFEKQEQWLINATPNLTHLILANQKLPSEESRLTQALNQKIRRLDVNRNAPLERLADISYTYLSNVRYINFHLDLLQRTESLQWYADMIVKMLVNFKNLKELELFYPGVSAMDVLTKFLDCLDMNEIEKKYKVKRFRQYSLFLKI